MRARGLTLRAGPLTAALDRGELRWIRLGEREALRAIYAAVRGPGWVTVPARLDALRVEADDEAFRVSFEARHEDGPLRFAWTGRIEGDREGTLRYVLDGRAETSFEKNRIGLCVLHPSEGCAGRPCVVEHGDGRTTRGAFPQDVAPYQPFRDIRAIRHLVVPGRSLEVRFDGEWFEMEDQRNWSDTSFKTYSTPVERPLPSRIEAGTRVRHEVVVRVVAGGVEGVAAEVPAPFVRSTPLRVGLALPERPTLVVERERLRALRLDHLRVDLSLDEAGFAERLAQAVEAARACGVLLQVAVAVPDDDRAALTRLAEACAKQAAPVATFLCFRRSSGLSDLNLLSGAQGALRAAVPGARIGGGASGWFADLNRSRGAVSGAEAVGITMCPQVHARDEATILENLWSLGDIARTARSFAGDKALHLTPVTLAPRAEPPDPRLAEAFGGEWVSGLLRAASEAGFASLTLGPALGPGGVVATERDTPAAEAIRSRDAGAPFASS